MNNSEISDQRKNIQKKITRNEKRRIKSKFEKTIQDLKKVGLGIDSVRLKNLAENNKKGFLLFLPD